jgi:L-iditol 2-dehydrogenase
MGVNGLMHVIKAKMLGAWQIVAIDPSEEKLRLAKECGATHTINLSKTSKAERVEFCRSITEGRGLDVVVDTMGGPEVIPEGIELCRRGGTYIENSHFLDSGTFTLNAHRHLAAKNLLLLGIINHPHTGYYPALNMMLKYEKEYPWHKLITHRFSLDQANEALDTAFKPEAIKVIFEM